MDIALNVVLPILLEPWPISSSGHAQLLMHLSKQPFSYPISIYRIIEHLVHGPTLLVVIFFFGNTLFVNWFKTVSWSQRITTIGLVVIADSVTFALYIFWSYVGKQWMPLWGGFLITTLVLLTTAVCKKNSAHTLTLSYAIILGFVQGLALLPGISRFGVTFAVARFLGFSVQRAFQLSFMIMIPISAGGFLLGVRAWYLLPISFNFMNWTLIGPLIISCVGAYVGFYIVAALVRSNRLWLISLYECIPLISALMLGL